jgi:hypothetical protein
MRSPARPAISSQHLSCQDECVTAEAKRNPPLGRRVLVFGRQCTGYGGWAPGKNSKRPSLDLVPYFFRGLISVMYLWPLCHITAESVVLDFVGPARPVGTVRLIIGRQGSMKLGGRRDMARPRYWAEPRNATQPPDLLALHATSPVARIEQGPPD